ncbi:MAG: MotE family protein [Caulobacter sp.]|nr:MotE family protein [Caulobacter sp.]
MKKIPRILPLAGIAVVGVLAVNVLAGARSLPEMFTGARAFAEELAGGKPGQTTPAAPADGAPAARPAAVCAPTAAELAREANLSPAELRMLQSLGIRRGELDKREDDIDMQLQLLAAAEAKLDARVKALDALKGDIQGLLGQADAQQQAEVTRMVAVFSAMKPKDAAARMTLLDDSVRLPIAAKMKERTLAAILAQMSPPEAKKMTESLARRFEASTSLAAARTAVAPVQMAAAAPPAAAPVRTPARKPAVKPAPGPAAATTTPAAAPPAASGAAPAAPATK